MAKKHFEAFARQVKQDLDALIAQGLGTTAYLARLDALLYAAETFALVARQTNTRFDNDRFMKATGLR